MWLPQFISWCLIRLKLHVHLQHSQVRIYRTYYLLSAPSPDQIETQLTCSKQTDERTNKGLLFLPIVSGFLFKWWHFANGRLSGKHLARIIRDNVRHLSMLESSIQFLRIEVCSQELYGALQDSYSASPVCLLTQMF